jgi:hypothetical protein
MTAPIVDKVTSILNDGYIKLGSDVDSEYRGIYNKEPLEHIFMNIYFPDIQNLSFLWNYGGLVIHPSLIYDYGAVINKGWQGAPSTSDAYGFIIHKTDNYSTKRKKLKQVKEWLKHPTGEMFEPGENKLAPIDMMNHEVVFNEKIPIKYIIGVICSGCPTDDVIKIKNKLKELNMDVPVYTNNTIMALEHYIKD